MECIKVVRISEPALLGLLLGALLGFLLLLGPVDGLPHFLILGPVGLEQLSVLRFAVADIAVVLQALLEVLRESFVAEEDLEELADDLLD